MEKKIGFRAIRDISPSLIHNFFYSTSSHNSYGDGMYFAYKYDFAKVFAKNIDTKKFSLIGEYEVNFEGNKLLITMDDSGKEIKSDPKIQLLYEELRNSGSRSPSVIKNEIFSILNTYDVIDFEGREFILKKEQPIILKKFSVLFKEDYAQELSGKIKTGEVVDEYEIKDIPTEMLTQVTLFLKEKECF